MSPGKAAALLKTAVNSVTGASLFIKMMAISLSLIALFGMEIIIKTRSLIRDSVKEEANEYSRFLTRQLESSLIDRLITGDLVAVSGLLKGAMEIYPDVKYLFILSPQKRVLVGTPDFSLSQDVIEANALNTDGSMRGELLETEWGIINDLAAPILGGKLGTLRIGISQAHINQTENAITTRLLLSVLLVSLIGAGISYLIAFIITKPLDNLMRGIALVENGNPDVKIRPWFNDEIGRLTEAFNNMAGVLEREKALRTKLMRKLITSQEEERQRISRELHDKTSQSLASIKIGLKVLEAKSLPQGILAKFEEFRALLNDSLDEIHELAVQLRPPTLGDLGLPQAVKELGGNFERTFGIKVEFAVDEYFKNNRLEAALEIGLYRIIQEAFSNIAKHSGAGLVRADLSKTSETILLKIKDNGRGFDPGRALAKTGRKPIGLFGMKERAEILGGKMSISSKAGNGTEITVALPEKDLANNSEVC